MCKPAAFIVQMFSITQIFLNKVYFSVRTKVQLLDVRDSIYWQCLFHKCCLKVCSVSKIKRDKFPLNLCQTLVPIFVL